MLVHCLRRSSTTPRIQEAMSRVPSRPPQLQMASGLSSRSTSPTYPPVEDLSVGSSVRLSWVRTNMLRSVPYPRSSSPRGWQLHQHLGPSRSVRMRVTSHDLLLTMLSFIRGEATPCDASLPETCQVGDLSGKFGKITSDPFTASYVDDFASTKEGLGSFFGNRSFVVHFANKTRITCGNFAILGAETGGSQPNATTGYASPTASATSSPEFTGAAASVQVQGVRGIMASGFMAAAFMLFA
ncbi:superoxide dismutase [Phlyctema vagabunda]|uniref:Superoxide dismutase n=1 Tax=Phlyctema vagabunda TaxID=108571 RepID=A0ABR4PNB3_9HELO